MRSGFTLMELMVVLLIGVIVMSTAYHAIHILGDAEKSTDKASQRAMVEARLTEALLRDLRSSHSVQKQSDSQYTISRWVLASPRMEKKDVTWRLENKSKVIRESAGEQRQDFDFDGLLSPDEPAFKLRLEKVDESSFADPITPSAPTLGP